MSYDIAHLDVADFGENQKLAEQAAEKTVEYLDYINPADKGVFYMEYNRNADSFDIRTKVWRDAAVVLRWHDQAHSFAAGYVTGMQE